MLTLAIHQYVVIFGVGAAALAFWVDVRFRESAPETFMRAIAHLVTSNVVGALLVPAALGMASTRPLVFLALFGVCLPVVVYILLTGMWLIRVAQGALSRYSH